MRIERWKGFEMATKRGCSTTKARCQEGWRLFFRIGVLYTFAMKQKPHERSWEEHQSAVNEHKEHIKGCSICNNGLKELQMTLEEMAIESGDGIS